MNTEPKTIEELIQRMAQLEAKVETLSAKLKPLELKQQQDEADAESIQRRKKPKHLDDGGDRPAITRMDFGGGR